MTATAMKNFPLWMAGLLAVVMSSPQAYALTREECISNARDAILEAGSQPYDTVGLVSSVGLGFTGLSIAVSSLVMPYMRAQQYASYIGSGSMLSVLGVANLLSGRELANRVTQDELRAFRQTKSYQCLVLDLGSQNRAENFIADVLAGWENQRLAEKYLPAEECERVLQLL